MINYIKLLSKVGYMIFFNEIFQCISFLKKFLLSNYIKYSARNTIFFLALTYLKLNKIEKAINCFLKCVNLAKDKKFKVLCYFVLGIIYYINRYDYSTSMDYFYKCVKLIKNYKLQMECLYQIFICCNEYETIKKLKCSNGKTILVIIEQYKKYFKKIQDCTDEKIKKQIMLSFGEYCLQHKNYKMAKMIFNCFFKICTPDETALAIFYNGIIAAGLKKYNKSIVLFNICLEFIDDPEFESMVLYNKGLSYLKSKKVKLAKKNLNKCIKLSKNEDLIMKAYSHLNKIERRNK